MVQHYVRYYYPGIFVSEDSEEKIGHRDPEKVKRKKNSYCFMFFDREEVKQGKEVLQGPIKNASGNYFTGGTIYTLAEVERYHPDKDILINNMKGNGYKRVIHCETGNWMPFGKKDVLVAG